MCPESASQNCPKNIPKHPKTLPKRSPTCPKHTKKHINKCQKSNRTCTDRESNPRPPGCEAAGPTIRLIPRWRSGPEPIPYASKIQALTAGAAQRLIRHPKCALPGPPKLCQSLLWAQLRPGREIEEQNSQIHCKNNEKHRFWNTPAEPVEPPEPVNRNHGRLLGASLHTRRGPG